MKRLSVRWKCAANGEEAVRKWRQGGFHLVLMDIQLPVMNGLEATKEIRRLERLNGIGVFPKTVSGRSSANATSPSERGSLPPRSPAIKEEDTLHDLSLFKSPVIIVALTASSLQSDRHEALAAGCNDFLTKVCLAFHNCHWLSNRLISTFFFPRPSPSDSPGYSKKLLNGAACKHSSILRAGGNGAVSRILLGHHHPPRPIVTRVPCKQEVATAAAVVISGYQRTVHPLLWFPRAASSFVVVVRRIETEIGLEVEVLVAGRAILLDQWMPSMLILRIRREVQAGAVEPLVRLLVLLHL